MTGFVSIEADVRAATRFIGEVKRKQVPFALARALTVLAFLAQRAEAAGIKATFKHPRPFTQRATLVDRATKAHPVATVYIRPEAAAYLAPFEFGGPHHVPGKGLAILEPVGIKLDAYGQIRGRPSQIAAKPNVFVGDVKTKAGDVWGFWQRLKGKNGGPRLKLLVRAAEAQPVHEHLGFEERARAVVQARGRAVFDAELTKAVAAARR